MSGTISSGVSDWILELHVKSENSAELFTTSLTDIELGPLLLESTGAQ